MSSLGDYQLNPPSITEENELEQEAAYRNELKEATEDVDNFIADARKLYKRMSDRDIAWVLKMAATKLLNPEDEAA